MEGTPRELKPIAEQVLAWVARERRNEASTITPDELRRIELCALATQEQVLLSVYLFG